MVQSIDDLNGYEREALLLYLLWFTIYVVLSLAAILLPGLAAMGLTFGITDGAKILAGAGGLSAAIFGFLKPNDYAAAFDAAIAEIRSLRVRYELLTETERADRLDGIFRLMAFKYQGAAISLARHPPPTLRGDP